MSENVYPKVSAFEASGYGVSASPKFPKLEEAVLDYWKKDGTFQASIDNREAGPPSSTMALHLQMVCRTTGTCSQVTRKTL